MPTTGVGLSLQEGGPHGGCVIGRGCQGRAGGRRARAAAGAPGALGHLIADWPDRKRQAAAGTLAALIDAIQRDLAAEDQAAGGEPPELA